MYRMRTTVHNTVLYILKLLREIFKALATQKTIVAMC